MMLPPISEGSQLEMIILLSVCFCRRAWSAHLETPACCNTSGGCARSCYDVKSARLHPVTSPHPDVPVERHDFGVHSVLLLFISYCLILHYLPASYLYFSVFTSQTSQVSKRLCTLHIDRLVYHLVQVSVCRYFLLSGATFCDRIIDLGRNTDDT